MKQLRILLALVLVGIAIYFFINSAKHRPIPQEVSKPAYNKTVVAYTLNQDDIKINNFGITFSGQAVLEALGEPVERRQTISPKSQPGQKTYLDSWIYPGLELQFITTLARSEAAPKLPATLSRAILTNAKYVTKRGLKVGDPETDILQLYGNAKKEAGAYTYGLGNLLLIKFTVAEEKVTRIVISADLN